MTSGTSAGSILIRQCVIPDYRIELFSALKQRYGKRLRLSCGSSGFSPALHTSDRAWAIADRLQNRFLFRKSLLFQSGLRRETEAADLCIVEFNLRAISTWLLLARRSRLGRPTVLWGHASGRRQTTGPLKRWMFRRCQGFIAYTEAQAKQLQVEFPRLRIWVAPNATMWRSECTFIPCDLEKVQTVLYVGRLSREKKPMLLARGFADALRRNLLPSGFLLTFVGNGPERAELETFVSQNALGERIRMEGHVTDAGQLRRLYSRSLCSASPGPVGLAATQSFAFGVPILIARSERHGPEIEACFPDENAVFFTSDNEADLAEKLGLLFREKARWVGSRDTICARARDSYSLDQMVDTFDRVVGAFLP